MSGGSLDYGYERVRTLAEAISRRAERTEHRVFAAHLLKCAEAAKALEWVWSGDCGPGDELELIRAVIDPTELENERLKDLIRSAADTLERLLELQRSGVFVELRK